MKEFIDKIPNITPGTTLNRATFMSMQGFVGGEYTYTTNGLSVEFDTGDEYTVAVNNGVITEVFENDKILTKTTTLTSTGCEVSMS